MRKSRFWKDFALNCRAFWGRAYVRVIGVNREPAWLIFETVLPLLGLSAYVFVYRTLKAPPEFTGFVILGGAMTAYWMNVLWSMASQFYWEKLSGQLELFLVAPMSRMAILLGMAFGGLFSTTIRAGSALILGIVIFNVSFKISLPLALILIFLLTMSALYGLGMMFSSLYLLWGREAWHISNLLQEPVYLLSGFYFPVKGLGFTIAMISSIIPLTLGMDGMRQLLYGEKAMGLLPVHMEALILAIFSILFLYLAYRALIYMEEQGRKRGTLTTRWQ
jgi:ABC-2 type transport system permease protein